MVGGKFSRLPLFQKFRLCLVFEKIKGKCKRKKIRRKIRRKEKICLKLINHIYILLQTHLIYFYSSIEPLNNLKICKFLTNFVYILLFLVFSMIKQSECGYLSLSPFQQRQIIRSLLIEKNIVYFSQYSAVKGISSIVKYQVPNVKTCKRPLQKSQIIKIYGSWLITICINSAAQI